MHFLSHYYIDRHSNDANFVAALTLPDLAHGFTKVYNKVAKHIDEPKHSTLASIHQGLLRHFEGDKLFHPSLAFLHANEEAKQALLKVGINRDEYRVSVLAHLLVEMLLDRQVILHEEALLLRYYELLEQASADAFAEYFAHLEKVSTSEKFENISKVIAATGITFQSRFGMFKERRFLHYFREAENILFGLKRTYAMATQVEIANSEDRKFLEAIHVIDAQLRSNWQTLLNIG